MADRALTRDLVRATVAVVPALFLAGAAVSLRLHLRVARLGGGFAGLEVLEQGVEVAFWFGLFVLPAAFLVTGLSRLWVPKRARRLAAACATFALAFLLFQAVFWMLDGLAVLYLAAGAVAYCLAAGAPPRPSPADDDPAAASGAQGPPVPPRVRPADA